MTTTADKNAERRNAERVVRCNMYMYMYMLYMHAHDMCMYMYMYMCSSMPGCGCTQRCIKLRDELDGTMLSCCAGST